jgi:hypothetical protein
VWGWSNPGEEEEMTKPKQPGKTKPKQPDWEKAETLYRSGVLSLREIGAQCNVSHVSVKKRADKEKWERDLREAIMVKAEAKVNREVALGNTEPQSGNSTVNQAVVIEEVSRGIAEIILRERKDVTAGRVAIQQLVEELAVMNNGRLLLKELGEIVSDLKDETGAKVVSDRAVQFFHKVISWGGRVDGAAKLASALERIVALERSVFGITKADGDGNKRHDAIEIELIPSKRYEE